jgi:MarR family transcriptional regulator for hemolysin
MDAIADEVSIHRNITIRLTVIARQLRNLFDRQAGDFSVTRSHWSMIAVVARRPGATQRTIAEALEMSEASAGRLVDRLCSEGLLRRQELEGDRRARAVFLTEKAESLLAQLSDVGRKNEQCLFRGFSDVELERLLGYLDRISANAQ